MKNIDRFVSNVSQCILQPLNVLILILNGTKICMITVSAKCKQVSHRVVLRKNSNDFSMIFLEKISQISMRILNITKREDTEYNSYCLTHRGPVDLRKWAIFNTILMSPKSWLSQEDLDAGCEHSLVPVDS